MTRIVTLTWNEPKNRWDMFHTRGKKQYFIMDFPPCENIDIYFRPHKDRVNEYNLMIEKVKD